MFKYIKFLLVSILFFTLFSCNVKNSKPLLITFSKDSTQIVLKDISEAGLFQLKSHLDSDSAYQNLVVVLETPGDNDSTSMEMELKGKLSLNENQLVFTPELPFVKGKTYLVETIINAQFASGEDIIKDKVGKHIKPQQKTLLR